MKKWIFLTMAISQFSWAGNSLPELEQRCRPSAGVEKPLYSNDFRWGYSMAELMQRFTEIYKSPRRLAHRAFWDVRSQTLKLPYEQSRGGDIEVSEGFVQAVVRHIEKAFAMKYVDAVFFPDMGHSHLLIPMGLMEEKYNHYPVDQMSGMYQAMFKDPEVRVLYHTAEQLTMLDQDRNVLKDPSIQWRHRTRNIVGSLGNEQDLTVLQNPSSAANTVSEVPGYFWWGAGFNISAQKDGCFEYRHQGRVYYFDVSMFDLEPDPEIEIFD